jgi:hypothetical protein
MFLDNLVRLFRTVTNGQVSLHLDGVQDYDIFAPGNFFGCLVNPTSDVPSDDNQTVPRDSRRTDPNGSPHPSIDLRTHSSQGSIHNLPPKLARNGLIRSGSPFRDRRPSVVPDLPTQPLRLPSNTATSGALTSAYPPSQSTDMNSLRLASSIHVICSLEQLLMFL